MPAPSRLTAFQGEVLAAFFRREHRFYLTGGAALAGFHLGHRQTHDLDLFSLEEPVLSGARTLKSVGNEIAASCEDVVTAPEFRRLLLSRGQESVIVDLVLERAEQIHPEKLVVGAIRVDPADEIFANKLCALLGRSEVRDLVDVRALEQAGLSLADALRAGHRKDGGLTAGQLAWVLSLITIGDDASVPGDVTPLELRVYLSTLVDRLARMAVP